MSSGSDQAIVPTVQTPTFVSRNWLLCLAYLAVALAAGFLTGNAAGRTAQFFWGAICGGAAWHLLIELVGIRVTATTISCPWRPVPWFPILAPWRCSRDVRHVMALTVVPKWFGFQRMSMEDAEPISILLFASRNQRLAFIDRLKAVSPMVKVYRHI